MKKTIYLLLILLVSCGGEDVNVDYEKEITDLENEAMALSIYDKFITQTDTGATVPNAQVTVNVAGGGLASLYDARTGGTLLPNPITADADGRVTFYVEPNRYNISADLGGDVVSYDDVIITAEVFSVGQLYREFNLNTQNNFTIDETWDNTKTRFYVGGAPTTLTLNLPSAVGLPVGLSFTLFCPSGSIISNGPSPWNSGAWLASASMSNKDLTVSSFGAFTLTFTNTGFAWLIETTSGEGTFTGAPYTPT